MKELLYYTWEVIKATYPVIILMAIISIPLLGFILNKDEDYESIGKYYDCEEHNHSPKEEDKK